MNYSMNLGAWNSIFAVPCAVVDDHIKLAGSAQLKVLLFLLRHAGQDCDPEKMSTALGIAKMDICDAMQYWVEAGLILQNEAGFAPAASREMPLVAETAAADHIAAKPEVPQPTLDTTEKKGKILPRPKTLDSAEIARRMNGSDEVRAMLDMVEMMFGRPLSTPEMGRVIDLHDWYGLPADVVIMIIQYAVGIGKPNMNYIEKMASNWAENDINTHEKAEQKIIELDKRQGAWKQVMNVFGIENRLPSDSEAESVYRWVTLWGFSTEMLKEAYNRCVDSTGKVRFSYINRILERWHKEGVHSLAAAKEEAARGKNKKSTAEETKRKTSYDIDEFEKMTLREEL